VTSNIANTTNSVNNSNFANASNTYIASNATNEPQPAPQPLLLYAKAPAGYEGMILII